MEIIVTNQGGLEAMEESPFISSASEQITFVSVGDWIQFAALLVITATLVVMAWELIIQNRLARAQLLRDRFETYWRTYDAVNEDQLREAKAYPEDYMSAELFEFYRSDDTAMQRYISMTMLFEYLAFLHISTRYGIKDPFGEIWIDVWTKRLILNKEFLEASEYLRDFYPDYYSYLSKMRAQGGGPQRAKPN